MKASLYNRKDEASVSTLRLYSADMVETAKSGHPGLPLGAAPLLYVLWTRFLKHDPEHPDWPDRDRFVMSPGHGSALLYALLHFSGYGLSLEDLKNFRRLGSRTPGHPERGVTPGVECTTGPLGQGFAAGVGLAVAERSLARRYNRPGFPLFDHHVYALVSDGDLMEGAASEAASFAGAQGLNKLIYLYDDNGITIEGSTDLTFTEDARERFRSYGWRVMVLNNGEDLPALHQALEDARQERERPTLVMCRTILGRGSPKAGKASAHGEPLGPEALAETRAFYGYGDKEPFFADPRVRQNFLERTQAGRKARQEWDLLFGAYAKAFPEEHGEIKRRLEGKLPKGLEGRVLPEFPREKPLSTRAASGIMLNALAPELPELLGGSADLAPSNKTHLEGMGSCLPLNPEGRNIHFGVREAAMGGVLNGLALSGAFRPFGGTFLVFSDYLKPAIRLAALMELPILYILTHDSVGVGEDGPTHQPVEHLAALRATPGVIVARPADAYETRTLYHALLKRGLPAALILSRQNLPVLHPDAYPEVLTGPARGAYVLKEASSGKPEIIAIATGSEVSLVLAALEDFPERARVRVVSFPSMELFNEQSEEYRESVLPRAVEKRLVVEAGSSFGWDRYLGAKGGIISVDRFGLSAPAEVVFKELGFSVENVVSHLRALLDA
ncbi:MAG: transketolase [Deltaproteobacteria bacterium]|jgi:transketolase|nr:transketolase [Deltaproteobacteria bacterium]